MPLSQAGSNGPNNDTDLNWMRLYRKQKRSCDEQNGVLRNLVKRAKSDGLNTTALIAACKATKLDPEVIASDLRDQIRYMALLRIPITQSELFDGWDSQVTEKTSQDDDIWDAEEAGYKAGRSGAKVDSCPYEEESEAFIAWHRFWRQGQNAIAAELGPDVKPADPSRARPERKVRQSKLAIVPADDYRPSGKVSAVRRKRRGGAQAVH